MIANESRDRLKNGNQATIKRRGEAWRRREQQERRPALDADAHEEQKRSARAEEKWTKEKGIMDGDSGLISEKNLTSCRQPDLDATISSRPPAAPVPKIHQPQYVHTMLRTSRRYSTLPGDIPTSLHTPSLSYHRI
jgi:hypothetical protein